MTTVLSDTDFIISDVKVQHFIPSFYTEGLNFVGNALSRGLHRLDIDCTIHFANTSDIRKFQALILEVQGRVKPFKLSLQDETDGKGLFNPLSTNASVKLLAPVNIGNTSAALSGSFNNIEPGTLFQFSNDSKVYGVTSVKGNSIKFYPAARIEHGVHESLNFKPIPLVRLVDDRFRLDYSIGSAITIKMQEAL